MSPPPDQASGVKPSNFEAGRGSWWTRSPTVDERLAKGAKGNNFDTRRLVASSAVILSHSFPVGEGIGTSEPMSAFTHGATLGTLAVAAFFIFSGLLVTSTGELTAVKSAIGVLRPFGERDLSYGVYLYGWPIQPCVAACLGTTAWYLNATVSFLVVVPIAFLSWTLIERPALLLKAPKGNGLLAPNHD